MRFLRNHWFDIGICLAAVTGVFLFVGRPQGIRLVLWLSLISLFLHQFEEYRFPGYFPGMLNTVMFGSPKPDRYPLNSSTSLFINVFTGWLFYLLAAVFAERAIWLGMATMMISAGNFLGHTFLFNIRGRTLYNPGMLTSIFLFLPITVIFVILVIRTGLATPFDWVAGLVLGFLLNYFGVYRMVTKFGDESTTCVFPGRCIPPGHRHTGSEQP